MTSTVFVDYQTVVPASWLNDVNSVVYGTSTPVTSGSFTASLVGCTTVPTITMYYTIIGSVVVLSNTLSLTGTSNTTSCSMTGLPASITPTGGLNLIATNNLVDNGSPSTGSIQVSKTGNIVLYKGTGTTPTSFTNSGTKGIGSFTITYDLAQ